MAAALDDYAALLDQAPGLISEETAHHRLLVATPLWGLLNGLAFCERLHLAQAQRLHPRRDARPRLAKALGHAARLHLLRRYLYREMWPVVESIFFVASLSRRGHRWRRLSQFALTYGEEAGRLAESFLECRGPDIAGSGMWLSTLDPRLLVRGAWTRLLALAPERCLSPSPSRLADALEEMLRNDRRPPPAAKPLPVARVVIGYLRHVRLGGLGGLLLASALTSLPRSLLTLRTRPLRRDPYSDRRRSHHSLPALRSYLPGGYQLIVDPVAADTGRMNHPGIENVLAPRILAIGTRGGYSADQLLIRLAVEQLTDPEGRWSEQLRDFVRRWTDLQPAEWRRARAALDELRPAVRAVAGALDGGEGRRAVAGGRLPAGALSAHLEGRKRLLTALRGQPASDRNPVSELLTAYYLHGL